MNSDPSRIIIIQRSKVIHIIVVYLLAFKATNII